VKVDLNKTHNLKIGILGHMFCHLVNNLKWRDLTLSIHCRTALQTQAKYFSDITQINIRPHGITLQKKNQGHRRQNLKC